MKQQIRFCGAVSAVLFLCSLHLLFAQPSHGGAGAHASGGPGGYGDSGMGAPGSDFGGSGAPAPADEPFASPDAGGFGGDRNGDIAPFAPDERDSRDAGADDRTDSDSYDPFANPFDNSLDTPDGEVQAYHGKRMVCGTELFSVVMVEATKKVVRVVCNIPIDPRTVTPAGVLINGVPLASSTPIRFNRTGKLFEFAAPLPRNINSVVTLLNVRSFDGQPLAKNVFAGIRPGKALHYEEP